jgi:NAD(P)-dependent dehydrogenase (short-subunit alcohol dehydrogenase family)
MKMLSALPDVKGTVSVVQLDVTDDAGVDAAAASIKASYGRLDVLVNSAGIFEPGKPRIVAPKIFETNVVGYINVTEAFLPLLHEAPSPRLVFLSSSLGSLTHTSNPESRYYTPLGTEYRATTASRNMIMN